MNFKKNIFYLLLTFLFFACQEKEVEQDTEPNIKENQFVIYGKINFPDASGRVTLRKMDMIIKNTSRIETLIIKEDGTFEATYDWKEPVLLLVDFYGKQFVKLAVNKGEKIQINLDGNNPLGFLEIKGSKDSEDLYKIEQKRHELHKKHLQGITLKLKKAPQSSTLRQEYKVAKELKNKEFQEYLRTLGSSIAVYTALSYLDLNQNFDEDRSQLDFFDKLYQPLLKKFPNSKMSNEVRTFIVDSKRALLGEIAPNITLTSSKGDTVSLYDTRGKYVLINFWSPYFGRTRAESPHLVKTYRKFRRKGFTIFGVALDDNEKRWKRSLVRYGLRSWTNVADLENGRNSLVLDTFKIKKAPANILLDREGRIIAKDLKYRNLSDTLETIFETEKVN